MRVLHDPWWGFIIAKKGKNYFYNTLTEQFKRTAVVLKKSISPHFNLKISPRLIPV
jgi:hypothetical protein